MRTKKQAGATPLVDPDDAPILDKEFFDRADIYKNGKLVRRGRPPSTNAKQLISLRVDPDVLEALRRSGEGWQTRVNDILRQAVAKR